ncbi:hypothetical protein NF556_01965 [Ornithinimicrobium faecis]|uniref:O-antigen ligase-like membrane protein n=1 Tax=Ornithinimicrobium faecis TaxID=2934158 RepID=A0ABY4YUK4_9MICO|nr:hypothetical protein [Ornithinimicrobium sp. HY1793]USQ80454.1 hypothetical protein NF556_01965 [Ornithinimicrobium sp. HY1793]
MIFAGLPLWWVLGVMQVMFFAMTVPMLIHLVRRRDLVVPKGLGLWLLLLIWIAGGVLVLQADAPGAVTGSSAFRYLTFSYRLGWYLAGTVVLLYVINSRKFLTTERIARALSWMFIALLGGGVLGVTMPTLEFPSLLETLLPQSISSNGFVNSLIHPQVAQIHTFLGYEEPRPSAPFAYTNEWGLAIALSLPFFIVSWWRQKGPWRWMVPVLLTIAVVPIVSSTNRGLWLALIVMATFAIFVIALRGNITVVAVMTGGLAVAAALITISPLATVVVDRLNTPHSNEGRTNLGSLAVGSTAQGSPLLGFGTTRDVEGNFTSIAGGATDQCPACAPPALGTQGQLWLLIFGAGFVGAALFICFLVGQLLRNYRNSSAFSLAAACSVIAALVTLPVYTTVGPSLYVLLIAVGVMHREGNRWGERLLSSLTAPALRQWRLAVFMGALGAVIGAGLQFWTGTPSSATLSVLAPRNLVVGDDETRPLSIDTEGALARSGRVISAVREATGEDINAIPQSLRITAEPNSRILNVSYTHKEGPLALAGAEAAAYEFLALRAELVAESGSDPLAGDHAQVLRSSGPLRLTDRWVVVISTGLMTGVALGLCLAPVVDGRLRRLRGGTEAGLEGRLPTLASLSDGRGDLWSQTAETHRARQIAEVYLPIAAVLADDKRDVAVAMATTLDRDLPGPEAWGGQRTLLIASTRSHPRSVNALYRSCRRVGLDPVGLILIDE